ncbi:MAG: pyridoxal phosphate-dependent aminotransferase [Huintestinicola sp.]
MNKYRHGGDIYSRKVRIDFSANINPLGMPESVKRAAVRSIESCKVYPDPLCRELTCAIAEYENVPPESILCGCGAADLIYRIIGGAKPKKILVTAPTFSEYEKAADCFLCRTEHYMLKSSNGFRLTEDVLKKIDSTTDMFFLCRPSNPAGEICGTDILKRIIERCCETGTVLAVDECFMDFSENSERLSAKQFYDSGIIILKAFTKIFAMAGLRLGYMICSDGDIIKKTRNAGQCWSVSVPAQAAGIAACGESGFVKRSSAYVSQERGYLMERLSEMGIEVFPSEVNFILLRSQYPLDKMLMEEGIAIRSCSNYVGLDNSYFRIAVRTHEENEILINALRRHLKGAD